MGKPANGNAVRIYTLNERATKFRNTAACLSWGEKTGSAEKKAYILSLLPPGATDTRSLGGDLNKQRQEQLLAVNKGKFPNRRRKSKRTLEAQAPMAVPTPGFQPQAPSVVGEVEGQSVQLRNGTEPSPLEGRDTQLTERNGPMSFNDLGSFDQGSQIGATQFMVGQDLNIPLPAGGAHYNGYYDIQTNSNPANFPAPSHLDPSQMFPNNGGDWSSLNNLGDQSYTGNPSRDVNAVGFFNPAQYGTTYGAQAAEGVSFAAGEARGFTSLQAQGNSPVNHPVNTPTQRRKRPRTTLAEDEAESYDNRRNKRVRTDAPAAAPQDSSATLETFGGGAESLLRFDANGFVITNNTPGIQGHAEVMYPAVFDQYLRDTQHEDIHAEDDAAQETRDAPARQESNRGLLDTPASLPTQGQKRRRSSPPEDEEEGDRRPKSKRLRKDDNVRAPAESIDDFFEEDETPPVKDSKKRERDRRSSESRGNADSDLETPAAKRQKADPGSDGSGASDGDNEATESSQRPSDADSDDDSVYTPSSYHQTSLKSIGRPTTGGKGPYKPDGRPVTGGKGPLKSTTRANMARKAPRKQK